MPFFDINCLRFLEFLKTLKLCMNFSHSNSCCMYLMFNFYFPAMSLQFIWLSICIQRSLLCTHGRRYIDGGNREVRVWNIQQTKSGTTWINEGFILSIGA